MSVPRVIGASDDEPPILSIVIDSDGDVYQRHGGGWYMVSDQLRDTWADLTGYSGPLTLVWEPTPE